MQTFVGVSKKLFYSTSGDYDNPTWVEIPIVKDCKVPMEAAEADASTREGEGWSATERALKSMSFEFNIVYDPDDSTFGVLQAAFIAGTQIDLWASDLASDDANAQGPRAVCKLFKFDQGEAISDTVMNDVVAKPCRSANPPAWFSN